MSSVHHLHLLGMLIVIGKTLVLLLLSINMVIVITNEIYGAIISDEVWLLAKYSLCLVHRVELWLFDRLYI